MFGQTVINIMVSTSSYVLVGVSFYFTFCVARFYHFTHGAFFALGAYLTYSLIGWLGVPLIGAAALAISVLAFAAAAIESSVYRPIRRSGGGPLVPLLASLGLYTVIQNAISMCYGDSALPLPASRDWGVLDAPGGRITVAQVLQLMLATTAVAVSWLLTKRTLLGGRMRAVGQDPDLSLALGLPVDRVITFAFAVGYGMAAMAGVAAAANVDLTPTMGMQPMMMGMVAMIIGGNCLWGTVLGAFVLAVAQHVAVIWLPTRWQDTVAFVILFGFLLVKPQGLMGKRARQATV